MTTSLEGPITSGTITPPLDPKAVDLGPRGYVEEEWFVGGTATSLAGATAPFRTRVVVRRPEDPAAANGVVALEWLNVSVAELSPDWGYLHESITGTGTTWVGVSTQAQGVVGGEGLLSVDDDSIREANQGIRSSNPERYGSLEHPGDAYAYDIFRQVAALLRSTWSARIVAIGESQSAGWLTAYLNEVQPTSDAVEGFLVHSRFGTVPDRDGRWSLSGEPTRFRTDGATPVLVVETETDVASTAERSGYVEARQPDHEHLRVWELAGTAHADTYMVGAPDIGDGLINAGPQRWLVNAAFEALLAWVATGESPPHGEPLEVDGTRIRRDQRGIALGGVRSPAVDVPTAVLSGEPAGTESFSFLLGSTVPFDEATLAELYPTTEAYREQVEASLDATIAAGFIRPVDREAYLAEAMEAFDRS